MEQNFQTSFIPKKPVIEERPKESKPIGLFTVVAIFIFFSLVLASGGLYFYDNYLAKDLSQMEQNLGLAKNRFEPSKIIQLQVLDKRLNASTEILNQHIAVSPIFNTLQSVTLKNIRYTKFAYEYSGEKNSKINVKMSGQAIGYKAVALQADLLSKNKNLIDPIFSNLSLDEKNGNVLFDLEFSVDPNFVNYQQVLKTAS